MVSTTRPERLAVRLQHYDIHGLADAAMKYPNRRRFASTRAEIDQWKQLFHCKRWTGTP